MYLHLLLTWLAMAGCLQASDRRYLADVSEDEAGHQRPSVGTEIQLEPLENFGFVAETEDQKMQRHHQHQYHHVQQCGHCPQGPNKQPCCPQASRVGCCSIRTTTDKVTTFILNRITTTASITSRTTKTLLSITSTTQFRTFSTSSTITTTLSTTQTQTSTTTRSVTLPNTTFRTTATVTSTAQQKTVTAIVTQEVMPCFTEYLPCERECPCDIPEEPFCPMPYDDGRCGGGQCAMMMQQQQYTPMCDVCPNPTTLVTVTLPTTPTVFVTVTVDVPPATVILSANVFCTTQIICAQYQPIF